MGSTKALEELLVILSPAAVGVCMLIMLGGGRRGDCSSIGYSAFSLYSKLSVGMKMSRVGLK